MKHAARTIGWTASGVVLALATIGVPLVAHAQSTASTTSGFAVDRFEPSDRGSNWFVLESLDWKGHLRAAAGLIIDYANKPVVLYDAAGASKSEIVGGQFFTHVGASLVVADRLRFGVSLPVELAQSGTSGTLNDMTFPAPDSAALGDLRLSGAVRFFGEPGSAVSLGASLDFFIPTGKRVQYSGDEKVRVLPQLLLGGRSGIVQYAVKAGFHYRALEDAINGAAIGSEVVGGAALGVRLSNDRLLLGPEVYGSTVVSASGAAFSKRTTPVEALLGGHYTFQGGWQANLGIGAGLTRGLGSPMLRAVAGLEWMAAVEPAPPSDRDHDGVFDPEDECPDVPGLKELRGCPPPPDRDGDGVIDPEDACPDVPGVKTDDPKTNGCPPPDRDGDGVLDPEDACPDVPGVRTDDAKTNGCPPPPPDRDGDTVLDPDDACPDVPGVVTNDPKTNGCPPARIDVAKNEIIITEQIKFKFDSAVILPESDRILNAVLEIVSTHPEIARVRIEGHTDHKGSAKYNKNLSARRAQSVMTWFVKKGVAKKRLSSQGFGFERPIDTNETDEGRQNNRRVEFHIESQGGR